MSRNRSCTPRGYTRLSSSLIAGALPTRHESRATASARTTESETVAPRCGGQSAPDSGRSLTP